jgi:hypothetical protein
LIEKNSNKLSAGTWNRLLDYLQNYRAAITELGRIWQQSGSTIYYTGSRVGIGTKSPLEKLHISDGNLRIESVGARPNISIIGKNWNNTLYTNTILTDSVSITSTGANNARQKATFELYQRNGATDKAVSITSSKNYGTTTQQDGDIVFNPYGNGQGRVGINMSNPTSTLHVNGTTNLSGNATIAGKL